MAPTAQPPETRGWVTSSLIAFAAIVGTVLLVGLASAHGGTSHGELTFHDSEDGEATDTVECEIWIRGHNMTSANGTIEWRHELGSERSHNHTLTDWTAEEDENGTYDFEIGPLEFHDHDSREETRVLADVASGHTSEPYLIEHTKCEDHEPPLPGDDPHECKGPTDVQAHADDGAILVAWNHHQDPEETARYEIHRSLAGERNFSSIARVDANHTSYRDAKVSEGIEYTYYVTAVDADTGEEGRPCDHAHETAEGTEELACPGDVRAEGRDDGDIALSWEVSENATGYRIHRASEGTGFSKIAETEQTSFVDGDTEPETTYVYRVTAVNGTHESGNCGVVEATAIPTFPTWIVVGGTALAGVGALVGLRRWR